MDERLKSYLTTFAFVIMALIAFFAAQILQSTPAAFLGIVTIIVGIISTYVDNNRATIDGAVEKFMAWKWIQYIITAIVMLAPFIQLYEPNLLAALPPNLVVYAAPTIAMILTFAAGQREKMSITPEE